MFSRLFSSKRVDDTKARSASPSALTEPASVGASAPPGSPTRGVLRTPSPVPVVDPSTLHSLFTSCPPKTVHEYILSRLEFAAPSEIDALSSFFAALEPPPRLHCVRCHKNYYEVDNDDRSCTIPHDDESAEVEHVGYSKGAKNAYETRWDCCGKTVEGDGDLGPPSGWCYEGKHTMDRKRARYRNDSTPANDLLESCESRGCHRKRRPVVRSPRSIPEDARSTRTTRSEPQAKKQARRKRGRENDEDGDSKSIKDEQPSPKKKRRKAAAA